MVTRRGFVKAAIACVVAPFAMPGKLAADTGVRVIEGKTFMGALFQPCLKPRTYRNCKFYSCRFDRLKGDGPGLIRFEKCHITGCSFTVPKVRMDVDYMEIKWDKA